MQLSLRNFSTLVEGMAAAVQGAAASLLDLTVGSVLRALLEANASVALWIQWLIVQVLATTRLATSTGTDCDSFGADFGFARLPAVAATGQVTFARFSPNIAAFIPVGAMVSVATNTISFAVTADTTNPAFNATLNGYSLAANVAALTVTIAATLPGTVGNVQPSAISLVGSALAGIDTVTNAMVLTGGLDAESDAAFRARFGNYLASLARATDIAVGAAIAGVQQGLSYVISESINQAGAAQPGHFVVTVDDGSGNPPASLLRAVWRAVDAVRPIGASFAVQGPIVLAANVTLIVVTSHGASHNATIAAAASAIETYIAGLGVGAALNYTKLAQLAYAASATITNVSDLLLNGGTADVQPPLFGVIRAGSITVS